MNNKNLLFLIFGLLFYSLLSYSQLPSYVPTNGLVAYWSFNGNANDESGNGNNGTVNGPTQTTDRFGNSNSAYNFDGINDYIMINNVVGNFGVSNFTISVWYNTQNFSQSHFINKRYNESCGNFWELRKEGFEISQDIACIENTSISNTQSIQLNNWYNVIIIRNGNVLKYYIDGILSQTTTTSIIHNINNNNNLIIGAVIAPISGLLQVHNGKIDDIGIWNRALTNSEIIQLYNNCTPPSAPIGSSTQTLCSDSTIANLTATGTNIQWYSTSTGGTALASTTALVNGTTYYASQTVSGCESTNRLAVTITLNNPTVSASSTTVCIGQPTILTATSGASTTSSFTVGSIGPSGGYVFYDQGSVINGWRYLEAAPSNIQNSSWGCVDVNISGATSTAIGNGLSNTNAIVTNCLESNIAAKRCLDHSVNGFDDWYLPSQNEFAQIYQNLILNNLGNFNVGPIPTLGTLYWTSTQLTASSGSHFCLECGGNFYQYNKTYELYVRPIRRFTSGLPFSSYLWSTGATTASINVNPTTTTQYWVDVTTNGVTCRKFITISVNSTTPAPTGDTTQTFCSGSTVANITVTGTNIKWYSTSTGGTALSSTTALEIGTTMFYASQTVNGCESSTRLAVTVVVQNTIVPTFTQEPGICSGAPLSPLPTTSTNGIVGSWSPVLNNTTTTTYTFTPVFGQCATPTTMTIIVNLTTSAPIGSSTQNLCSDSTVANLTATGTNIQWYATSTGGTALSSTTALVNGTTYYASQTISGCESTSRLAVTVSLNNPTVSASSTTVCIGQPTTLSVQNSTSNGGRFFNLRGPSEPQQILSINQWHNIVVTKDNLGGKVFIDGNLVIQGTWMNNQYNWIDLYLGANYFTGWDSFFKGWIDEIRVSNIVRPDNEIINNYNQNTPYSNDTNTIGLWHFDEVNGTNFLNQSNNISGDIYNGAVFQIGKFGNGLYFDGIDDRAICNFNMPENNFTLEMWVKIDGDILVGPSGRVVFIEPYGVYNSEMGFFPENNNSTYLWSTGETTPSITVSPTQTTQYSVNITTNGVTCTKYIIITVGSATPAPTGDNNQTMAQGSTLANLVVTGQNILWFSSDWGGTPLPINTPLVNGVTYYASQFINGCEGPRLAVTVQLTLNNNQFNSIQLKYSPNPVFEILNIKASTELKNAKICNLLGQTIFQQKFNSNEILLNMSDVPTGTYFVIVESDDRKETFKILKK